MKKDYAVHPGKTMKYLLLSIGKNQKWLSEQMGMSKVVISELINGKRNVTPAIAIAFEKATSFSADTLIKIQAEYDLFQERVKEDNELSNKTILSSENSDDTKTFVKKKSSISLV